MEIFDVVDEKGNPTGETVERNTAHEKGIRHRTAHIWIARRVDGRWQVLLQKRSVTKDSFPGRYDTSSAGHIRAGEEPRISAVRELKEELGIDAKPEHLKFAGTFPVKYEKEFHNKMFKDNEIAFVYVYLESVDISQVKVQEEELECVEWFDMDYVHRECLSHNQKFCVPVKGLETAGEYLRLVEKQLK